MLPFQQIAAAEFEAVNRLILKQLHSDVPLVEQIGHYLVEAGGKRLRPLVVLLAARACGYTEQRHIDLAAVIEFIHTATLLHDDVVDTSELRRGRATANAKWGNAPSVLVGDFLYSRAFQIMVQLGDMAVLEILSNATNLIAEGEVQQLVNARDPDTDEDRYYQVIRKKTAVLFAAAAETAAVLAGAAPAIRDNLRRFGEHLGLAFQLVDDALDYRGDAAELGKNLGDDLAEGKPTLPLIHAMAQGTPEQAASVRAAIADADRQRLPDVVAAIEATGGVDYTLRCAREQVDLARAHLHALPASEHRQALLALAEFAAARSH